jgi:hypothetical protein
MTKQHDTDQLVKVKQALSEKYFRLAKICKSRPKRATFLHHAESYRLQAEQVARR